MEKHQREIMTSFLTEVEPRYPGINTEEEAFFRAGRSLVQSTNMYSGLEKCGEHRHEPYR